MSAPFRFPKFFVTNPSPCPYLPGKVERKVFTEFNGRNAGELNEALGRIGFRRSQSVAYRPVVHRLQRLRLGPGHGRPSSRPTRPSASSSAATPTLRSARASRGRPKNNMRCCAAILPQRHPGGGMAEMDEHDFADMVEQTPVRTYVIEYREPSVDGRPGKLVGACLSDQQGDGLSMIYSFYDVGERRAQGARHLHHPRPHHPRRARRPALCLPWLLGRRIRPHGL